MRNFQFALRTLAKSPVVSIVAILSLALGIGANTAIFSLFEQTLLRKLPATAPEELVNISANGPRSGSNSTNNAGNQQSIFSYPMFRDLEKSQTVFTGIAAHRSFGANLAYQGQTSSTSGMFVSGSYFPILGLKPTIGRLFTVEDDKNPGAHPVTVLAHSYWKEKFNENPDVVGKSMVINGAVMTIIGVGPSGFQGTTLGSPAAIFVPISMREALTPGWKGLAERKSYWVYLFARLKPELKIEQAQSSIHGTYIAIIRDVELQLQKGMSERTRKQFLEQQMKLSPGEKGQSGFLNTGRAPMVILTCIAAFVLLIACANIANLLLARSANRAKEFSIRLSLGASRAQVMAQLLIESLVLALLAGIAGVFVAYATGMAILTHDRGILAGSFFICRFSVWPISCRSCNQDGPRFGYEGSGRECVFHYCRFQVSKDSGDCPNRAFAASADLCWNVFAKPGQHIEGGCRHPHGERDCLWIVA
ncbi:MAG: ABC transporter permease [Acidobacteria bacterium]|nr:ABC transporter permease [Acidobacteriota bacterium]